MGAYFQACVLLCVVGYSLGGASALSYAARMPDLVATVVVAYPLTEFIKDPSDFVAKIKVPVQMFAGTADTYKNCCMIGDSLTPPRGLRLLC